MGIGIQGEACAEVPEHSTVCLDAYTVFVRDVI